MLVRLESTVSTALMDDGGLVLLCERTGKLHRCNATAATMWTALLHHDGDPEGAASAVASHYGVEPDRVRADLDVLLAGLSQASLVRMES